MHRDETKQVEKKKKKKQNKKVYTKRMKQTRILVKNAKQKCKMKEKKREMC